MMRLAIEKIVYPGRRLGSDRGKTVFADEGLPGEIIEAEPIEDRKNYCLARTVRVLLKSKERVEPRCGHYLACSSYQSMAYGYQLEMKKAQLREILGDLQEPGTPEIEIVPSLKIWNYRNKVRLSIRWRAGTASWAYHAPGSQSEFVEIEECHLVSRTIHDILAAALRIIRERELRSLQDVEVKESRATKELLLVLSWSAAPGPGALDPLLAGLLSRFSLAGLVSLSKSRGRIKESTEWGRNFIEETIGETHYAIGARSFFQVNTAMLGRVVQDLRELGKFRGTERLADLYCGIGTFGLALAGAVKDVFAVESEPENIIFLKKNIEMNAASNVRIFEGPSEEWVPLVLDKKVDAVIFDPPRKGLGPEIVRALIEKPAGRIFYLSCNPTTLARDLKDLSPAYRITTLRAYDFFPHTPHIETLASLEQRNP